MNWSQLVGKVKLVARRSISPVGRSSEKLTKLCKPVDFLDDDAGHNVDEDKGGDEIMDEVTAQPGEGPGTYSRSRCAEQIPPLSLSIGFTLFFFYFQMFISVLGIPPPTIV
ncbi:hypothetical protein LIER_27728 [Lithospermum erythrorhizon]|uniref:Uncharacterized protein n=1 Tax=Lithospermum erythrorhizon TaxID=34254 RepID=A0AAV3RD57_LITER